MLKKVIKYTDYNGIEREEPFYFNLSKGELMEMELMTTGGLEVYLRRIIAEQDQIKLVSIFKELIIKSYGKKSDDGKRFIKSKELTEEFIQTEAYSELYIELVTDPDQASKFINGIVPPELAKAAAIELKNNGGKLPPERDDNDTKNEENVINA